MTRRRWIGGWHRAVACVMLAALFVAAATVPARADDDAVADELIVGLQESVSAERAEAVYQAEGASRLERVRRLNVDRIRLHGDTRDAVAQRLRSRPEVAFVERNRRVPPAFTPNDPLFTSQWHLPAIASPQAWDVTTGSPAVIIAVLDSGGDASHPDLAGQLVPGWNFYSDDGDTSDVFGHGTLVAGVAAAIGNNGIGVAGVAMQSRIMAVRVTDATGSALFSTVASAITWAADHGARVLNISFTDVATSAAITSAADYARSRGALVVAAAGNCGCLDDSPANPSIISVSATAPGDALA